MPRYAMLYNLQPARLDIIHYRGDTLSINCTLSTHGMPLDLTNWTFTAHVRQILDGPQVAKFDIEVLDPLTGKIRVFLTPAQSQSLNGDMQWDLQAREESTAKQHTLIRGTIRTTSDVTYPPSGPRATVLRAGRRRISA